mmetsp:Transcript_67397/g.219562  ORF Transcript_67397/g.219562 Transcript_67397/m.219562 type:complete len:504 (-) Transcript_67397:150-1661(-)
MAGTLRRAGVDERTASGRWGGRRQVSGEHYRCAAAITAGLVLATVAVSSKLMRDLKVFQTVEPADLMDRRHVRHRELLDLAGKRGFKTEVQAAKDWGKHILGAEDRNGLLHASAYLHYQLPWEHSNKRVHIWYHTLVPKRSADDTYFAVEGTNFGYFGLQQIRDYPMFEGKVIFSQWDHDGAEHHAQASAEVLECGPLAVCTRFGGEGTGAKSYINFHDWKLKEDYMFVTVAEELGPSQALYSGYFHAEELGGWVLLSKIKVCTGSDPWHIAGMYSFTEQWTTRDYAEERWQMLGPSYVEYKEGFDGWSQITQATFSYTSGSNENNENVNANVTIGGKRWGLGIGGKVQKGEAYKTLKVNPEPTIPSQLKLFECLQANGTLPTGCAGGTCTKRAVSRVFREAFSSSHLITTGALGVSVLLLLWMVAYYMGCCVCCSAPAGEQEQYLLVEEQPSQSSGAVSSAVGGEGGEGGEGGGKSTPVAEKPEPKAGANVEAPGPEAGANE